MYVKVISDDIELEEFSYKPLKYGHIYRASFENKYYTRVFFSSVFYDDEECYLIVHDRHLKELNLDEIRDFKLKKIGI